MISKIDKGEALRRISVMRGDSKGVVKSAFDSCIKIIQNMPSESDQSRHVADLREEIEEYQDEISQLEKEAAMREHQIATLRAEIGILSSEQLLLRELLKDQLIRYAEEGEKNG